MLGSVFQSRPPGLGLEMASEAAKGESMAEERKEKINLQGRWIICAGAEGLMLWCRGEESISKPIRFVLYTSVELRLWLVAVSPAHN